MSRQRQNRKDCACSTVFTRCEGFVFALRDVLLFTEYVVHILELLLKLLILVLYLFRITGWGNIQESRNPVLRFSFRSFDSTLSHVYDLGVCVPK